MRNICITMLLLVAIPTLKASITFPKNDFQEIIFSQEQKFSQFFYNLGVTKLIVNENSFFYTTHKEFIYNNRFYNLQNYNFTFSQNNLFLGKSSISLQKEGVFLNYDDKKISFKSIDVEDLKTIENYVLYITFFELGAKEGKFSVTTEEINKIASLPGCNWWNTITITGIGRTQAGSDADLYAATINAANSGQLVGCRSLGGVSHDDFGIIKNSSQSFCCDRLFPAIRTTDIN